MSSNPFDIFSIKMPREYKDKFIGKLNITECYNRKHQPIIDQINFNSAMDGWQEELNLQYEQDKKVLDELYKTLNDRQIQFIKDEIEESCGGSSFQIINNKPSLNVEFEKEEPHEFNTFVDQWNNYPCEDCYSGYVYVEIEEDKKYLMWHYEM